MKGRTAVIALVAASAAWTGTVVRAAAETPAAPQPAPAQEVVVLMHGLSRSHRSMNRIQAALEAEGYEVINLDYSAGRRPIEDLSCDLEVLLAPRLGAGAPRLHFVTHSFGGILLRYYLRDHRPANLGRAVMLSPPNEGSELADVLKRSRLVSRIYGPNRARLGTDPDALPAVLGPVDFELGVITGDRSINPVFSALIPGRDDGFVAVKRAGIAGMADFLVVRCTHAFIMRTPDVIGQVVTFLSRGRFDHPEASAHDG